jgi:hypothetical protein
MHFGVALMMNFGVGALDERLLLLNGNHNPLPRISVRWNSQQSVRVSVHYLQVICLSYPNTSWESSAQEAAFLSKKKEGTDVASLQPHPPSPCYSS